MIFSGRFRLFGSFLCSDRVCPPAGLIKVAERTADVLLVVFTSVPFGFTGPVVLAFFTTVQFFEFLSGHNILS